MIRRPIRIITAAVRHSPAVVGDTTGADRVPVDEPAERDPAADVRHRRQAEHARPPEVGGDLDRERADENVGRTPVTDTETEIP